ncbi:hypothetical protein [Halolactibacillus alkaliphilus]|uniref:hypothetical protein n=1 Tax=Halolactibacillus alkaliphilus TaxID=442899 RepID=UPI0015A707DD|nr:hypothetical protein [Halolactibacillus alkaliphilus]
MREKSPVSIHQRLKQRYGLNDYTERFDQSKLCSLDTLFPQEALTEVEKIGLRRLESRKTYA